MLSGDNGLLKRAGDARDDTVVGQEKEQVELAYVSAAVKKLGDDVDEEDLRTELNNSVGAGKTTVSTNGDNTLNVNFTDTKHNYTVNGGIVTRTADGEVEVVPVGKVAKIGTTYYESLQDAFDDVPTSTQTEVILLANISENVLINSNKNIILDLNSKTITNVDNTIEVEFEGETYEDKEPTIKVEESGILELKNGIIISNYGCAIESLGTVNILGGTYSSTNNSVIYNNGGTMNISNGNFNGSGGGEFEGGFSDRPTVGNAGQMTITGGIFTASVSTTIINFEGTLTITGGTISQLINGTAINNEGTASVSGATINGTTYGLD